MCLLKDLLESLFCNSLLEELKQKNLCIEELKRSKQLRDLMISELIVDVSNDQNEVEALRKALNASKGDFGVSIVTDLYSREDLAPTQGDKPSPHSSLSFSEAVGIAIKQFKEPRFKLFSVQNTNSMEPFIDDNSLIIAEKLTVRVKKLQPIVAGDVCIYEAMHKGKQTNIIHRVVKKHNRHEQYYFKGDNNFNGDGYIHENKIKYRLFGNYQTRQRREND